MPQVRIHLGLEEKAPMEEQYFREVITFTIERKQNERNCLSTYINKIFKRSWSSSI
jgi:hypothetical protein